MNEIRFDLEDIIKANLEEDVLYSINMLADKLQFKEIKFWHNGGLDDKQLTEFIEKSKKIVTHNIPFRISDKIPQKEYIWFDVISDIKAKGSKNRYSYVYPSNKKAELLRGIHNFSYVVSSIESLGQGNRVYYKPKEK